DIDDAQVFVEVHRSLEQGKGFVGMVALPFHVPEISQSLGMSGIESQLALEFLPGFVILLRFPVQIAEAEMNVGLAGRNLRGPLELGDGFTAPPQAVEGLAGKHMGLSRIRVLLLNSAELFLRAIELASPQAALR